MKALKRYLVWNSGRSFSRQITKPSILSSRSTSPINVINEHRNSDPIFRDIIEWNENGSLFSNLQYNHLQNIFEHGNGSQFFDLFVNGFQIDASKLLSYAKYAPQTSEGNEFLSKLMGAFADIGDYNSCSTIFQWLHDGSTRKIVSIDDYNILLRAISNYPNISDIEVSAGWDVWAQIKKSPISFNAQTVHSIIRILTSNGVHSQQQYLKQFVKELLTEYQSVISLDIHILTHLLPHIEDIHVAFRTYQEHVHLSPRDLSLSMFRNVVHSVNSMNSVNSGKSLQNEPQRLNALIMEILNNFTSLQRGSGSDRGSNHLNVQSIAQSLYRICTMPMEEKRKYKFDDPDRIVSIFESQIMDDLDLISMDNHYINYLLDSTKNMKDIDTLCASYGHHFDTNNLYHMIHHVIYTLKLSKEMHSKFISFVLHQNKALMENMTFYDAALSLRVLSVLNKHIVHHDHGDTISTIEAVQSRIIELFTMNEDRILAMDSKYGHQCIVYNLDEIIGIIAVFSKHRTYNESLMNLLAEQMVVNLKRNVPRHAASISYFDHETEQRAVDKNVTALFPVYTSILRHLRHCHYYQRKLYSAIASSLQKRPDIIKVEELRFDIV